MLLEPSVTWLGINWYATWASYSKSAASGSRLNLNVRVFHDIGLKYLKYKYVDEKAYGEDYKVPGNLDISTLLLETS